MMHMHDELDLLEQAEADTERAAGAMDFATDLDRRQFMFLSLVTAAATTFGFGAKAIAQGAGGGASTDSRGSQGSAPPVPLDNMEAVSWTFQPYPGGTGVLLEKTYHEKGVGAFARQKFAWDSATPGAFRIGCGNQSRQISRTAARDSVGREGSFRGEGNPDHMGRGGLRASRDR
jgi:hypothetical protein